ncbi:MAG: aminoacetone oxidase family FAD-binding enzyme [Clostridiales bacterium]|nr:aminoacetone oxidase family FAD-binding enzyme [Clostridiales bacterium]
MKEYAAIIVGGGASGLMAACTAARVLKRVAVLERKNRIGKKILATGNGRCNLTNMNCGISRYHGENPLWAQTALESFGPKEAVEFFGSLGLVCRTEDEGRVYPYCGQASAVLDVLRNEIDRLQVDVFEADVCAIEQSSGFFRMSCKSGDSFSSKAAIIAAGGCASPSLGSDGGGFMLLSSLGHKITRLYPVLAPLKTSLPEAKSLRGIRAFGSLSIEMDGCIVAVRVGELQFTGFGLSGIPAMDASGYAKGKPCTAIVDLCPEISLIELEDELRIRRGKLSRLKSEKFLIGFLNRLLGLAIMKISGLQNLSLPAECISDKQLSQMASVIKGFRFPIAASTQGLFRDAQATGGGADLAQFNPRTMESSLVKGVYACGEVLDIYGDCGGFNLQWAWSSGHAAGLSAAEALKGSRR